VLAIATGKGIKIGIYALRGDWIAHQPVKGNMVFGNGLEGCP
jgi:hypothetical protein